MPNSMSRRQLLVRGGAAGAALTLGNGFLPSPRALATFGKVGGYPFISGVASGDPAPDSVVLWTRLALDPLGETPLPPRRVPVAWEIADDEGMRHVRRRGLALSDPATDHSIRVAPEGLLPGREYWYRFYAAGEASPVGRTRTAPGPGQSPSTLRCCLVSCSQFEHGYFTAYRHIVADDPAFVVHVGDYIYEYGTDEYVAPGGNIRHHIGPEVTTLAGYRRRYGQYHTDADLLEARRLIPFITTPDDHEVENNYATLTSEADHDPDQDPAVFLQRRTAAFRAYAEWMPLRDAQVRRDGSLRLFRELPMGDLCDVIVADTRQFRTDQPCDDRFGSDCPGMTDAAQTLPGLPQEQWLEDRFTQSRARWNLLAQQVQMAQEDFVEGPGAGYNTDSWDGYKASRKRVLAGIQRSGARNPVVLTGDVHQHYASDLSTDFGDPNAPIIASEFVGTSIASGGDGSDAVQSAALRENPWIKYNANRRGYVRFDMAREQLRADLQILPYISTPDAPVSTGASFVIQDGRPGLLAA